MNSHDGTTKRFGRRTMLKGAAAAVAMPMTLPNDRVAASPTEDIAERRAGNSAMRTDSDPVALGEAFLTALEAQDLEGIEALMTPEVRLRALTPGQVLGGFGPAARATMWSWWGAYDRLEFLWKRAEMVSTKLHLSYRYLEWTGDQATLCEQQVYCVVEDGLIADMSLLCAGSLPVPAELVEAESTG
jgi:hypothetical protein